MFRKICLLATFVASPSLSQADNGMPALEIHDRAESAAAVSTTLRMQPLAGQFGIQHGMANGQWTPGHEKSAPRWVSRHAFDLTYDPQAGTLTLLGYSSGQQTLTLQQQIADRSTGGTPNLMRIEVANFDANASVSLEKLELVQGETVRALRSFGRGTMTSDLATVWESSLAEGFTLHGTLKVDGAVRPADARVWVDFGLGSGQRVAIDVEGYGWVKSSPAGIDAAPGSKQAVGFFARNQTVRLEAMRDPAMNKAFLGWTNKTGTEKSGAAVDLTAGSDSTAWTARFEAIDDVVKQLGEPPQIPTGNGGVHVFTNNDPITIPAGAPGTTMGQANPFPSTITVNGPIGGAITDVNIRLDQVTHTHPDDLDVLIVSPFGDAVLIMSDACGNEDVSDFQWTFDDQAAAPMSDSNQTGCVPFFVQPTNYGTGDTFPNPAPADGYNATLSAFNDENPNGIWRLFVFDDANGDVGDIGSGWDLTITTEPYVALVPGSGTSGPASQYPLVKFVIPTNTVFGAVIDANIRLVDMTHEHPDDLDILIVGPGGQGSILMSDACGNQDFNNYIWTFDDEAAAPMSDDVLSGCNPFLVQPTNYGVSADIWPAPAPAGPFTADLSVFDGLPGTGAWTLFINDDASGDVGFLETDWFVELELDGIFQHDFEPL